MSRGSKKLPLRLASFVRSKSKDGAVQESIPRSGKQAGSRTRNYEWTYYYSPQTQSIVKYTYLDEEGGTREIELVKFTAKKPD